VLLPVLFAMLLCLGWQLLHEAAACTVVHAAAKHFICGLQHGAAWSSWHTSYCCSCCVCFTCNNRLFQAMFRQLVVANSLVCWVVLEGVFGSAQQGACSRHACHCCPGCALKSVHVWCACCSNLSVKHSQGHRLLATPLDPSPAKPCAVVEPSQAKRCCYLILCWYARH
jgi:hypothetical protein